MTYNLSVTAPVGAGIEYALDGGLFQVTAVFNGDSNGSHSIVWRDAVGCPSLPATVNIDCGCATLPTLAVGALSCSANFMTYTVGFTASGGTVTSTAGTLGASSVTGIPAGQSVTITVTDPTNSNCTAKQTVSAPNCDCATAPTTVLPCDDGNPCTMGDLQTILNLDGSICVPCAGTALDCATGTTTVLPCDDGNPNTVNDLETILDCDDSVCLP